jgi:hypothetical protein
MHQKPGRKPYGLGFINKKLTIISTYSSSSASEEKNAGRNGHIKLDVQAVL